MSGKTQRILVIDNEPEERAFLRTFLGNMGIKVFAMASVQRGIASFQRVCPDLLIVDALSPAEAISESEVRLKALFSCEDAKQLPVIFISTIPLKTLIFSQKQFYRQLCSRCEKGVCFLERPLQGDELIDSIQNLTRETLNS